MTLVVSALVVVVILLSVLVAGLLRSHAVILRRLHELGAGVDRDPGAPIATAAPRTDGSVPQPRPDTTQGRHAVDIVGTGPRGESLAVRVTDVAHDTVLVFLSTGCTTCASFWEDLAAPQLSPGTRLVVVTQDAGEESPTEVLARAPAGVTVVLSSAAWRDLAVPGSPFVIHVHGPTGRVLGEGTAPSWERVRTMILRADDDAALGTPKAAADQRREQELDRLLLEAGIGPGDPSLYGEQEGER